MVRVLLSLLAGSTSLLRNRRDLAIENLALRQQLALYKQRDARPRLSKADRAFWVLLSRTWSGWREALVVVKPETVIAWHRKGFRLYWTWKSRRGPACSPKTSSGPICRARDVVSDPIAGVLPAIAL